MSKRLQVLLSENELAEIRTVARDQRMTVAEWVRQALRKARRNIPERSVQDKLNIIRKSATYEFPVSSIEILLAEIENGYLDRGER